MERKLAAILSADVVGYSRLMADDQDATVRTLTVYREQIELHVRQHRGRLADFSGDNFLAEFPTAQDAVECAIEIQRVLRARNANLPDERRMQFRIGAHMGDVAVDGDRIYGDGVNIAARLESLAEPGGICISATVHEQVRNKLPVGYDDLGDQSVKNIPDQVHVYQVQLDGGAATTKAPGARGSRLRPALAVGVAGALLLGVVLWATWPRLLGLGLDVAGLVPPDHPTLPDKPSIVVLPFSNMSGDPEQEYFADGITEDLTTDLSRTSSMFVIARNSAFTYKGRAVKVGDVGRELGVRYVLEGSVRRAGDRVRITAQLIDATNGFHVWSERYDRSLEDVFAVQSEISEEILLAVGLQINEAELARLRRTPTEDLTAYDAVSKGMSHLHRLTRDDMEQARRLFERAIELDPDYAGAVAWLAATYSGTWGNAWDLDPALLDRAWGLAQRAVELDPAESAGYVPLATVSLARGNVEQSILYARKAIALSPSAAVPHGFLGVAQFRTGQREKGMASLRRAARLNPRFKDVLFAGLYERTGRREEAIRLYEQVAASNPDNIVFRVRLMSAYMAVGREADARAVAAQILRVNPDLTADALSRHFMARGDSEPAELADALRRAGLQ